MERTTRFFKSPKFKIRETSINKNWFSEKLGTVKTDFLWKVRTYRVLHGDWLSQINFQIDTTDILFWIRFFLQKPLNIYGRHTSETREPRRERLARFESEPLRSLLLVKSPAASEVRRLMLVRRWGLPSASELGPVCKCRSSIALESIILSSPSSPSSSSGSKISHVFRFLKRLQYVRSKGICSRVFRIFKSSSFCPLLSSKRPFYVL